MQSAACSESYMYLELKDTHGSNQYRNKKWCKVCGDIVSDLDAD